MANPICLKHNIEKYQCLNGKSGLAFRCKKCRCEQQLSRQKSPLNKEKRRAYRQRPHIKQQESIYRYRYEKKRKQVDPIFKLLKNFRSRLITLIKKKTIKKSHRFNNFIGCSKEKLKEYIESQFKEGMTWENHGKWHIDHIIPLSSAKTQEDLIRLSNYNNLQPLWQKDNILKGNKYAN
jgi:hypothetical protein